MTTTPYYCILGLMVCLLSGCQHLNPRASSADQSDEAIVTDTTSVITDHDNATLTDKRLNRIETQLTQLQNQLDKLNQQQIALTQLFNTQLSAKSKILTGDSKTTLKDDITIRARQLYNAGLYSQVIKLLKKADHPDNDTVTAQTQMWLLLLSHARLNNCESVINISQRFTNQFSQHPQTAHALYLMGNCQQRMQQNDIARNTYQRIINHYPHSSYAAKAQQKLK